MSRTGPAGEDPRVGHDDVRAGTGRRLSAARVGVLVVLVVVAVAGVGGWWGQERHAADPTTGSTRQGVDVFTVCRGDVEGIVAIPATVGIESSPDDGADTVTSSEAATVVLLGEVPARSGRGVYVGELASARLESGTVDLPGHVTAARYEDGGSIIRVAVRLDRIPVGMTDGERTTVSILVGVSDDTLYIPTALLHRTAARSWVQVRRDGTTTDVDVRVGLSGRGQTEVVEGLRGDDQLVVPRGTSVAC